MPIIADFHIHSHFSLATSKQLNPQYLDYWAKIKGLNIVGTGDFTHPGWTNELEENIEPAEEGLFKLKNNKIIKSNPLADRKMRFILSSEISNIYKKNGKVRKVHNVVLAPNFQTVYKIQQELENRKFNIRSDGRPILGLDSYDLLEFLLEINENIFFIPAHIWTPWFAALGSKSGFDSIQECYGNLSKYIYAVETGLSSDQPLNWLCSFLDKFTLLSNSDAHSPEKLGRNANILDCDYSYNDIIKSIKNQQDKNFIGTIDMYPQEGKYHFDGHRKCNICYSPEQTMENKGICPECGTPLTLGVVHRIAQLADRNNPQERKIKKKFYYLIPLKEILSQIQGVSTKSKSVDKIYHHLIASLGSEFDILLNIDLDKIKSQGGKFLSVAIDRMRKGNVIIKEGFDGEYGTIKLFEKNEIKNYGSKKTLFDVRGKINNNEKKDRKLLNFDVVKFRKLKNEIDISHLYKKKKKNKENIEQKNAIKTEKQNIIVIAGPGTGKTRVLTERIKFLVKEKKVKPEKIWAVTFSNQAANQMQKRICEIINKKIAKKIQISTFHAAGLKILKDFSSNRKIIINDNEKRVILKQIGVKWQQTSKIINKISVIKNSLQKIENKEFETIFDKYNAYLEENNLLDFDDLIYLSLKYFNEKTKIKPLFEHILIDEFQDINNAQYEYIKQISNQKTNIYSIGDPNQSIYGFRGSDVNLINNFIKDFDAEKLTLSKSYRCSDNIISASQNIVGSNKNITGLTKGVKINISEQATHKSEAEFIARNIEDMIGGLRFFSIDSKVSKGQKNKEIESLSDFAVLLRTKSQFDAIIKAFNDHSIPYQKIGTKSFLSEKPFSEITTILKHFAYANNKFYKARFKEITNNQHHLKFETSLKNFITELWEKYFQNNYKNKINNFQKYLKIAENKTIEEFLILVEQKIGQDDYNKEAEAVRLMTLHASKGLEFKCVFIPGLENGLIPYSIFKKQINKEEEKRLLYVGMTRAEKYLYLTYAKSRKINNLMYNFKRSPFIDHIQEELLQYKIQKYKSKSDNKQFELF